MIKTSELIWQDAQHQVLFDLIDLVKIDKVDQTIFTRLREYAENHFVLEEIYMERLKFPHMEEHIQAHNKFRVELESLLVHQHEYDQALRESLSLFLSEWLKRHVLGIDKKLEAFILQTIKNSL